MKIPVALLLSSDSPAEGRIQDVAAAASCHYGATERDGGAAKAPRSRTMSAGAPSLDIRGDAVSAQIFGEIFYSSRDEFVARIRKARSSVEAARILVGEGWGSYVAFLTDLGGAFALRDPSGAVPLYIARAGEVQIASTWLTPKFARAAGFDWRVELRAVAKLLITPPAPAFLSGVKDVEIAVPGRLVSLSNKADDREIWSAGDIARRSLAVPQEELVSCLDDVLRSFAGNRRIGVELSGGFDSSTVFGSLAQLGYEPKPFNFATAGKGGDEARFAADVAERWDTHLNSYASGTDLPDYSAFDAADHGVQPTLHGLDSVFARARQDHIDQSQVDMIMTGQGGDATFFNIPTRLVAADRRRERGTWSLVATSTIDDARRVRRSIWSVLAAAFGRRAGHDRTDAEWLPTHLLGREAPALLAGREAPIPWLEGCDDLPAAKALHVAALAHSQLLHGELLFAPSVPTIHPLLTQPLIEMFLSCPTYVLQSGLRDRSFARDAFGERLPKSVLNRRNKGEASDHYARAILHNRDWLLSHFLGGKLVETGLLNGDAVESALETDAIRLGTDFRAFVHYASMESWLRYWS